MYIPLDQLPYLLFASAIVFGVFTLILYIRASFLKKNIGMMTTEMEQNPIEILIEALEKEKTEVEDRLNNGNAVYAKLLESYALAETKVGQINVGLPPPNFKIDDDENLKSAVRECRTKQLELVVLQRILSHNRHIFAL